MKGETYHEMANISFVLYSWHCTVDISLRTSQVYHYYHQIMPETTHEKNFAFKNMSG